MKTLEDRIEYTLDKIRPYMQSEGGDIKIDHYDKEDGTLYVTLIGACDGCSLAPSDIKDSVETILMNEIPQITNVKLTGKHSDDGFRSLMSQIRHPIKDRQK
jgi:Fe-S cluster biogenesis protein NfuA